MPSLFDMLQGPTRISGGSGGGGGFAPTRISSGGTPSFGGTSTMNFGALTPQPTTTKQQTKKKGTTDISEVLSTSQQQTKDTLQAFDKQNITDEALATLQGIVTGQAVDPLVAAKDVAAETNIAKLQEILDAISPEDAATRAGGRTAELARQLKEEVLPEIFQGAELAGTGGNALAQLLAQRQAVLTGEAQSRAEEEARNVAVSQLLQGTGVQGQLTSGTSAESQRLLEALGISKGAIETGEVATSEKVAGTATGTTTTKEATAGEADAVSSTIDPLAWAKLQGELSLSGISGPTRGEKQLAAFMAAGGDPAHLTSQHTDFSTQANRLLQSIQGLI